MSIVFGQVLILFVFLAIGYALAKGGIAKAEHADLLSRLLVYVFLPASVFKTFSQNCTVSYIGENYILIITSLAIVAVLMILTGVGVRLFLRNSPDRAVYEYSVITPNFGYMGYAIAEALFGAVGMMNAMMFAIPMSLYVYTFGFMLLSKKKATLKNLLNPMMLSLLLGALCGVLGLGRYIPTVAYSLLDKAGACMAPVSMLLVGLVLSEYKLSDLFRRPAVYIVSALRLLLIPMLIGAVLLLFKNDALLQSALILYAMPCGLNTVVFVKNAGGDCRPGAALALVSNIFACATVPLVLYIFGIRVV